MSSWCCTPGSHSNASWTSWASPGVTQSYTTRTYIGKPGGVFLSKIERSTDQVIKPVNLEALSKWTGHIPRDMVRDMAQIAPMLARLSYDPYANPPNYGNPNPIVINNTHRVLKGNYKTPVNLKGYFQVNQNSTIPHLGSS